MGFEPTNVCVEGKLTTIVMRLIFAETILKLVAGLGFEPRMAKAYETSLVTRPFPQQISVMLGGYCQISNSDLRRDRIGLCYAEPYN